MQIDTNTVVTLQYLVQDTENNIVDPGEQPLHYLHGNYDTIFPSLESHLHGKSVGDSFSIELKPEDAFGLYNIALIQAEPRHLFPTDVEVGMIFESSPENGDQSQVRVYAVTEINSDSVVLDANHPLAGIPIIFSGKVVGIRAATADEIKQQQAMI